MAIHQRCLSNSLSSSLRISKDHTTVDIRRSSSDGHNCSFSSNPPPETTTSTEATTIKFYSQNFVDGEPESPRVTCTGQIKTSGSSSSSKVSNNKMTKIKKVLSRRWTSVRSSAAAAAAGRRRSFVIADDVDPLLDVARGRAQDIACTG